jgi:hypothetical protein
MPFRASATGPAPRKVSTVTSWLRWASQLRAAASSMTTATPTVPSATRPATDSTDAAVRSALCTVSPMSTLDVP